ncbi:hypothetical protein CHL78_009910 [Romboutsia weinsteinii]|uniref:Uncharacterized protein n=1 Tax=Romboutsia weinsteinii TaxID=2020949 RepID=A0A371J3D0_9FIRM|nr:hypothetical protein [Romboutsia weinsteinii]RDY27292.1 hypothetical protein CHL78_009910 [Romboutsia weinsteinii]
MNKYTKIGAILAGIILTFQSVVIINIQKRVKEFENISEEINMQASSLINDVSTQVKDAIHEELGKSYLTKYVKFNVNKIEKDRYILDVRVEMSKVSKDSNVYFMYKDIKDDTWEEELLTEENNLTYTTQFDYKISSEYEYKVVLKGDISESGDIAQIDKYDFIPYPPSISYGESIENGEHLILGIRQNKYDTDMNDEIYEEIESVDMILNIDGKEKSYKCKHSIEDITYEDKSTIKEDVFEVKIPKKDYKDKLENMKMKIIYKNGLLDIKDITSEVENSYIN